ncbi:unnamed protein product [Arabidopsis arenosa]|uniref:Uncharacterized protein n=1 Tax=Arabidopsis arenosa TaxID=38785 RepID=A0A8S2A2Z5_ARAAE|nr:unnamed protein product [Arabidopsis arenosa]
MSRFLPQQQLLEKEQQLLFTDQQTGTGVGRTRAYDAIEFTSDRLQLVEKVFRLEPIPLNPPFHLPFSSTPLPPLKAQSSDFVPPVQACDLFARLDGKVWWKEGSREFQMCSTPLAKQALVLSPFLGAQDGRR